MTRDQAPDSGRPPSDSAGAAADDQTWTFRGYQLSAGDFTSAMIHFFRAEISRANIWRQRLDATTNWAVITTGAAISIAFRTESSAEHGVIILSTLLVTLFLYVEARRYRYYELWSYRVRLMETDFFAAMLVPPFRPRTDWAESLAENLLTPSFPISMWEAWGRRYRRNYLWIYLLLALSWGLKVWIHPTTAMDLLTFFDRATIGGIPGGIVVAAGFVYNGLLLAVGLATIGLMRASGEVLPRYGAFGGADMLERAMRAPSRDGHPETVFRPSRRRGQVLAWVITEKPEAVADSVLRGMSRGMTAMSAKGMYTGQNKAVLMSALTITEVKLFESLVEEADPHGFVIVTPAQEIMGSGFIPLSEAHGAEKIEPRR